MANPDHLAMLERGVETWNRWRRSDPQGEIDLRQAALHKKDLAGINLAGADLRRADLSGAQLAGADFRGSQMAEASLVAAVLKGANLTDANLNQAYLIEARLIEARLTRADLTGADLSGAHLLGADLKEAILANADLNKALLRKANLMLARLPNAILNRVDLSGAEMRWARLNHATLVGANLSGASLSDTDLSNADFRSANLQNASLGRSIANSIKLWESQRAGWSIRGIQCEEAYWDRKAKEPTSYQQGEFERLYSDYPSIELFYQGGVSTFELSTLPAMLRHLASLNEGANIRLKSIEETGGGVKISISVGDSDAKTAEKIKVDAMRVFQSQLALRDDQIMRLRIEKEYAEAFSDKLIQRMLTATAPSNTFNAPVYNAAFASGRSTIVIDQIIHDNAALLSLLEAMLNHLADLRLTASEASRFEDQVKIATSELGKKEPDQSALTRSLGFVQELAKEGLKKAAGTLGEHAVSANWQGWFTQLQELSHHLHL